MSRFDAVVKELEAAVGRVFPAAQLIVADGGRTALDVAVGDCDQETWFDVASLTKALVTTNLALRLCAAGRLNLDDELRPPGMTVRHALCHATGLPAWLPLASLLPPEVAEGRAAPPAIRALVRERLRALPVEVPPGSRSLYSDLGFLLLGEALADIAGAPLDVQWQALAEDWGVLSTYHPSTEARIAPTHADPVLRGVVHDENARLLGSAAHAGLFSTARDVSHLAAVLVAAWHGDPPPAAIRGPIPRDLVRLFWSPCGVPGSTWCLGWDRPAPPPAPSQAGTRWPREGVGHLGFTGCSLWIDPPRRRWVVLLSNRVYPSVNNAEDRRKSQEGRDAIRQFRPALHDAIVAALDG
ncbi:MAG TPA: serine hydrolase domain-containing protein [Polyangia bacterium]|jgi:CubicO group peptidase (beta-lactamase class C family)|nr:serine hydrolase domain-containing protein [Polyangia bacterium]